MNFNTVGNTNLNIKANNVIEILRVKKCVNKGTRLCVMVYVGCFVAKPDASVFKSSLEVSQGLQTWPVSWQGTLSPPGQAGTGGYRISAPSRVLSPFNFVQHFVSSLFSIPGTMIERFLMSANFEPIPFSLFVVSNESNVTIS